MPKQNGHVPSYRLHKPSGQARTIIAGRHIYLGKYGSPESHEQYARLIAEAAQGRVPSQIPPSRSLEESALLINELVAQYWAYAETHYSNAGKPTKELPCIREALRRITAVHGNTRAAEFGPRALKTVRQHMIDQGLSRGVINSHVGRIKRMFKWAVAEELVTPSVFLGLQAVAGLRYGRSEAKETEPVRPVCDLHVAVVLAFVTPQVGAMIRLQRVTGMRPGELVAMRPCDIETDGDVWIYEPAGHKNRWRGHQRIIMLGPAAQAILEPFLHRDPQSFLFSPRESEQWRLTHQPPYHGRERKTPTYDSELRRRGRIRTARRRHQRKRPLREAYDTNSYRRAIEYGLQKARKHGFPIPHWHPHQLRHTRATEVRRQFGVEGAQVTLGHARADVTQVYAEKNLDQAWEIAKRTG